MAEKEGSTAAAEGVKIEKTEPSGIKIQKTKGELAPPLTEEKIVEEEKAGEEVVAKKVIGKIPLSPAVVKPPLRFEGLILSEITGYPHFIYTEEELEEITQLVQECGLEADPRLQVLISLGTIHAVKFADYQRWKRSGRPGDLKKKEKGEVEKTPRPKGEEVLP